MPRWLAYILISLFGLLAGFAVLYKVLAPKPPSEELGEITELRDTVCACSSRACADDAWEAFVRAHPFRQGAADRAEADRISGMLREVQSCRMRARIRER